MEDISRQISAGTFWNLIGLLFKRASTTIFTIFLARFLTPESFGLIAMITICFQLGTALAISGLGQALVQSKSVNDDDRNTVFFSNLAFSGLAYILIVVSAPFVADFYDQPELTKIIRVVSLVVLINGFKLVQTAVHSRSMNFKIQMQADGAGALFSGVVAVLLAYLGFGVWSLVAQILLAATVSSIVLWIASDWRPRISFSWQSFRKLSGFGSRLLVDSVLNTFFSNAYVIVIGRVFSADLTGMYFFATKITSLVADQLSMAFQRASFPALAALQDQEDALKNRYRQLVQISVLVISLGMAMLAALADPLFELAFDSRWGGAIPYLRLLCVGGALYPLHAMNVNLLQAKGRADLFLNVGLLKKALSLLLLFASLPFGVIGIVSGQVVYAIVALIPNGYYSAKLSQYSYAEQMNDAGKPISAASITGLTVWALVDVFNYPPWIELLLGGFFGLVVYIALCMSLKAEGMTIMYRKVRPFLIAMFSPKSSA